MKEIILASSSPRRKELMALINVPFIIISKDIDETLNSAMLPCENVEQLALKKAEAVAEDYQNGFVIGCDTVVAMNDRILGKPKNEEDAKQTLSFLSGKEHTVHTGVAILCKQHHQRICFSETTKVKMKELTKKEIDDYVASKEPMDKAGSYAIQGQGAIFIEKIEGDYYNVVGLPVCRLYQELKKLNHFY